MERERSRRKSLDKPKGSLVLPMLTSGIRRILFLTLLLGVAGTAVWLTRDEKSLDTDMASLEKEKILDTLKIRGVTFQLGTSWEKFIDDDTITKEWLTQALHRHLEKLEKYLPIPEGLEIMLLAKNPQEPLYHTGLDIQYDLEKMELKGIFEIQAINASNTVKIGPDDIEDSTVFHELAHAIRAANFVAHEGFEEGLAEHIEIDAYPPKPSTDEKASLFDFLNEFPELEQNPLENPVFGFREFMGRGESELLWVVPFKHEIRRRAWKRFLDREERKDFLRKLQMAQQQNQRKLWTIEDILRIGETLDPEFRKWFLGERVFQTAEEKRLAHCIFRNGFLSFLIFEQRKIPKLQENHPDVFEIIPPQEPISIFVTFRSGATLRMEFHAEQEGIIQHLDFFGKLRALKIPYEKIAQISIEFASGETIPLRGY